MVIIFAYWIQYTIMKKNWIMVSPSTNALLSHTHTKKLSVGVKVEGILRQSADVEEVKRRVRDYEKGDFFLLNLLFCYLG